MRTTYELIALAADRTPDQLAIVDDLSDRAYTYRELIEEVEVVAAGLSTRGIIRGSRFATVLPNRLEHCLLILALGRLGAVVALMNGRLPPEDIAKLMDQADISGACVMPDPAMVSVARDTVGADGCVLVLGDGLPGAESFTDCCGAADALESSPPTDVDDLAYIFYTSGTTGLPKGVLLPHRTTLPRVAPVSVLAGVSSGSDLRMLGLAPLSHCIGFYCNFLISLVYNGTYFLSSNFDPAAALASIERNRITVLFTVPTFYFALLNSSRYRPEQLASLEHVLWGGAAIQPDLLAQLQADSSAELVHIYGTTEGMFSLYNPSPGTEHTRVRPGYDSNVRVVEFGGTHNDQVSTGDEGELLLLASSDAFFDGYLGLPEVTADKIRDGWYYCGDICRVREDGDLDLAGRVDDIVRSGGENIHPDEVEAALSAHPAVTDVGVVGIPDDYYGQMVVAWVIAADDLDISDLDTWCKQSSLADYKRPRAYALVDALPRSAANKLLRNELKKLDPAILHRP